MKNLILSFILLTGCTAGVVPQTVNQGLVVSYSQISTLALDTQHACSRDILSPEQCLNIKYKLRQALDIMNETSDLVLVSKLLLEVTEIIQ